MNESSHPSDPLIGLTFEDARQRVLDAFKRASSSTARPASGYWRVGDKMTKWLAVNLLAALLFFVAYGLDQDDAFQIGLLTSALVLLAVLATNLLAIMQCRHISQGDLSVAVRGILQQYEAYLTLQSQRNAMPSSNTFIPTGHSQLSIVNAFRSNSWIKIPFLLLAEGDIIALMGGDVTPCKVYELQADATQSADWTIGQLLDVGTKILINKHDRLHTKNLSKQAPPETKRSRSKTVSDNQHAPVTGVPSMPRLGEKHRSLGPESIEILRLAGDIRCFLLAETPIERFVVDINNKHTNTMPTFLDSLFQVVFDQGLTAAKGYVLLYLLVMVLRLGLLQDSRMDWALTVLVPLGTMLLILLPVSVPLLLICTEAMGTAEILSTLEVALHSDDHRHSIAKRVHTSPACHTPTSNALHTIVEQEDDEFVDEDIDARAEDIAEETDDKVEYRRFFLYMLDILLTRLGGRAERRSRGLPLLPVPLASMNIVDQLGAITMVCFVDDEVICENYSVTEEIFLLTDKHDNEMDPSEASSGALKGAAAGPNVKSTVLDLHANPEATGSRFENPLWWKFLPSLKPLGVNALLTYKQSRQMDGMDTQRAADVNIRGNSGKRGFVEKSLVRHIQQTLPLESLRELAEEIGFTDDDLGPFTRALDINVIASGLENAHLLEDNHQWGQEESRRRGSLLPQLRGAVYQDTRGGLQMMSLGDPMLILNYCREYWDGSTCSITPLSAVDRHEVLNVYDRWRLEDFDVVAFCYTPMPVSSLLYFDDKGKSKGSVQEELTRTLFFVDPSSVDDLMGKKLRKLSEGQLAAHLPTPEETQAASSSSLLPVPPTIVPEELPMDEVEEVADNCSDVATVIDEPAPEPDEVEETPKTIKRSASDSHLSGGAAGALGAWARPKGPMSAKYSALLSPNSRADTMDVDSLGMEPLEGPLDFEETNSGMSGDSSPTPPTNRKLLFNPPSSYKGYQELVSPSSADDSVVFNSIHYSKRTVHSSDEGGGSDGLGSVPMIKTRSLDHLEVVGSNEQGQLLAGRAQTAIPSVPAPVPVALLPRAVTTATGSSRHHHRKERKSLRSAATMNAVTATAPSDAAHRLAKAQRRSALRSLWSLLRGQIFLGMAASSVPVRADVPNTKEDLDIAGIRFVYFSAQNMKRSKPVAEKLGIPFDWNCAISLRNLDSGNDPHRHISSYADWDVLARMPHGVEAIKEHIANVDNVPLLVSLFTDATPVSIEEMVGVFRTNGEVVLSIGAGYRACNQQIYSSSNLSTSVTSLPNILPFIPAEEKDILALFPPYSSSSLSRSDLRLSFDLIGLGTLNLLQLRSLDKGLLLSPARDSRPDPAQMEHLHLSVLLETIRKGRVLLLNKQQALALGVIFVASLGAWNILSLALPISVAPFLPAPLALIFILVYLPTLCLTMLFNDDHEHVMKNTPRKTNLTLRQRDSVRFYKYIFTRVGTVCLAVYATGFVTAASVFRGDKSFYNSLSNFHQVFGSGLASGEDISDGRAFCLVQDMMANAALLALLGQSATLLVRAQRPLKDFPWPRYYKEYYVSLLLIASLHILIMALRSALRNCALHSEYWCNGDELAEEHSYSSLHGIVWAVLVLCLLGNMLAGFVVNHYDGFFYRRHLQFLRLEFDTRLGMHSPR